MDASRELQRLAGGYQVTQAIHVAARLGISDLLATSPKSLTELASSTGTDEESLARLMHALTALGLYTADGDAFANTELGAALRVDAPHSVAGWARFIGTGSHWEAYTGLEQSIRTGETAFPAVHGEPVWEYRAKHPDEQAAFDAAMTSRSDAVADAVPAAYDFSRYQTVVDIGGGRGQLLARILERNPSVSGVLFDQPDVVAGADDVLAASGVAARCKVVGGNFFESVPAGDAMVLKSVIHDWADAESIQILRTCRRALPADGRVLLVEQLLDRSPDPVGTAFSDLNMLVMTGGRERTTDQYEALFAAAGLGLSDVVPTGGQSFIIEATPRHQA
ncbi:methyltransferase [Kribbella pratensis]|uniref:Hydroxyneurosporene-O-methyltransferase n=1 Tax=Kribbella pratensis TaxID=2512112 RepID=A0A4R8BX79_9ACTN|nr:methyltransferase [Kribbella pratensis]TDW66428.1 hydroxyneurosporene-O-methyltransferase [Kribbella pratensis]